ncbi:PLA2G [Mytilus edulis]|uniref:PLA2G n=1 Tax=Mytilus edulis TaxID=6550 RepID=A0A8S3VCD0_MYTED|nr:PLA2G [Mytilus edulis]
MLLDLSFERKEKKFLYYELTVAYPVKGEPPIHVSAMISSSHDTLQIHSWFNRKMRISGKMITVSSASLLFVIIVCITNVDSRSVRQKRTIFQLCTLINYYTNRTCTDYNDYGCYCGYGQAVGKPRDYADACCRKHDNCYGRAVESCYLFPQIVSIGYTCDDNTRQCRCTEEKTEMSEKKQQDATVPQSIKKNDLDLGLLQAAKLGHTECVSCILATKYVCQDISDSYGNTPLFLSVQADKPDVVKLLVNNGDTINSKGVGKCSPLHVAAKLGNEECLDILIINGANLNSRDSAGNTPLILAANTAIF